MIISEIKDAQRYYAVLPLLKPLMEYIAANDLAHVPAGRIALRGDDLFINVNDSKMVAPQEQKLEVHRRYADVHIPLSGVETIGWSPLSALKESYAPFDEPNDFALYSAEPQSRFRVEPGQFLIAFPEDAHAPLIGKGQIRKLVAKIKL